MSSHLSHYLSMRKHAFFNLFEQKHRFDPGNFLGTYSTLHLSAFIKNKIIEEKKLLLPLIRFHENKKKNKFLTFFKKRKKNTC